jgi:electron transfer flavoprotein beta subunit
MEIIVCIKQVPGTTKVNIDEKTGVLKRDGVESKLNPYDLYALEFALRIKEKVKAGITVITMGPNQSQEIIKEAYMLGADNGYLLTDKRFAGADVLATSYALAQGIKSIGHFDLIICGKQTTDGDTAQVGPAIAEFLRLPHISWVSGVVKVNEDRITVKQDMLESIETAELIYPGLITIEKGAVQPRLPSFRRKLQTENNPINILTLDDLDDKDANKYGLAGSPTQVERIFSPAEHTDKTVIEGSIEKIGYEVYNILKALKFV